MGDPFLPYPRQGSGTLAGPKPYDPPGMLAYSPSL